MTARLVGATPTPDKGSELGDALQVRESEVFQDKQAAWAEPGLRVQLGFAYELIERLGRGPAPGTRGYVPLLRLGWRFCADWDLSASVRYSVLRGPFDGVRWSVALAPSYRVIGRLFFSLGAGYAGLLGSRRQPAPFDHTAFLSDAVRIDISGRKPRKKLSPLNTCDGDGFVALGRLAYFFTIDDLMATGPSVHVDSQWTRCTDPRFLDFLPEGFQGELPHQWWSQQTLGFAWLVAWR